MRFLNPSLLASMFPCEVILVGLTHVCTYDSDGDTGTGNLLAVINASISGTVDGGVISPTSG